MNAKSQWEQLRAEVIERIREIDRATPWQPVEPSWWLQMRAVHSVIADQLKAAELKESK